ncbi:MAG: MtnX-like HAD-IB family phosphatase [Phycisphaerae bacterium]|nr:MtnX-like HAD-IB family phosphatase [Phycisphaerae bacterium]
MSVELYRSSLVLPAPSAVQMWLDFDGTITRRDVLDELIQNYAINDSWKLIEERWQAGLIGSRECLRQEFDLIRIAPDALERFLDTIEIDSGLLRLLDTLRTWNVPVMILSDGIDRFIRAILKRHGIGNLVIRSNALAVRSDRMSLRCPHEDAGCESAAAHCKCASASELLQPGRKAIYVGDGRSDLCPARKCDVVFAKGVLASSLAREGINFVPYTTLADVAATLEASWTGSASQACSA